MKAKRIGLFLASILALYILAMLFLSHVSVLGRPLIFRTGDYYNWPGGDSWTRFHAFDREEKYDAIIIGSSHAYRGYDPAIFAQRGYSVYNLGSSAQTPLNSYNLIKYYLDSRHCPLLIFDIFEDTFTNTGLESTADLTQNITSGRAALGMAWDLRQLRGANMMALRWSTPRRQPYYESNHPVVLGFEPMLDSVKKALHPQRDSTIQLFQRQEEFFEATVRLCRERGIRLVVAQHYARRGINAVRHATFAAAIDSILASSDITFLDYAFAPGIHDLDHFADQNHLNAAGAKVFTGHLVDSLEALGYLRKPE